MSKKSPYPWATVAATLFLWGLVAAILYIASIIIGG
jgi:hypothetical protein